jgi:hypothetical protein
MLSRFERNCLPISKERTGKVEVVCLVFYVCSCVYRRVLIGMSWSCAEGCVEDLRDFVGREGGGRRMDELCDKLCGKRWVDELCIGKLGGQSVKECVGEVVCGKRYVANVSNRMGERERKAKTPVLTRRRSVRKDAVSVMVGFRSRRLAPPHSVRESRWLVVGEMRAWQRCGRAQDRLGLTRLCRAKVQSQPTRCG